MTVSDPVPGHEQTQREVRHRAHGGSVGMLACVCGWNAVLGPYETLAQADGAVGAAWVGHIDPDPMGLPPVSPATPGSFW